jgi:putative transposase
VKGLCARYGVTRAGYYAWRRPGISRHEQEDERLSARIAGVWRASDGTYGGPRIHAALQDAGFRVGRKRVARLMRKGGLKARSARIYRHTRGTRRFYAGIANLVSAVTTSRPDQIWVSDVTFLRTGLGWRYLAVVMDRHSRRILGWSLQGQRDLDLTLAALNHAVRRRRRSMEGLTFHSDRGSEYGAYAFRARLAALGITQSMKRPRELGDNAFIESLFHSMKADAIHARTFPREATLRDAVRRYICRYNRSRPHSSLGYRTPIDYERAAA